MPKITLAAIGAAALFALSGSAASAQDATPYCSKTVTDNCMQREGHAVAAKHHAVPKHHATAKHHRAPAKHRVAAKHHVAVKHHRAPHHKMAAKAAPAPARKM